MIIVTGGAGFIGSALVWGLNRKGEDEIIIVDQLDTSEKWKNLVGLKYLDYYDKSDFLSKLEGGYFGDSVRSILHMGACSSTTEKNADFLMENNYRYTLRLAKWREEHSNTRLIYASSAATYGDGTRGYLDNHDKLAELKPLNGYGYSKHLFDLHALKKGWLSKIVGLKFFNVFGPNENHKGDMRSVINKAYPHVRDKGVISLFKSYNKDYKDGEQKRDFIYIKDAVEMTLFFIDRPEVNGLFNIGTGKARTWNEVAKSLFAALNKKLKIEYVPMPEDIRGKYQYFTQADLSKLQAGGCTHTCMDLKDSVKDYVREYLEKDAYLSSID